MPNLVVPGQAVRAYVYGEQPGKTDPKSSALQGHSRSLERSTASLPISDLTMGLSRTISEINGDSYLFILLPSDGEIKIYKIANFSKPRVFNAPL